MLVGADHTGLLNALFATSSDADVAAPWPNFLSMLATTTQSDGACLLLARGPEESGLWTQGNAPAPDAASLGGMRYDRVYAQSDFPGQGGAQHLRAVKSRSGKTGQIYLSVHRRWRDFRGIDTALIGSLVPFLGQAALNWHRQQDAAARAALDRRLCAAMQIGALVFNRAGTLRHISDSAARILAKAQAARIVGNGKLEFSDTLVSRAFRGAFMACLDKAAPSQQIEIGENPQMHMILEHGVWQSDPAIIGLLRAAPMARSLLPRQIALHFHLSNSEARLAALLCDGFTLADAATELDWTIETARSCSKRIFARTHTRGQSDLVRKVLNSAIWLEPSAEKPF